MAGIQALTYQAMQNLKPFLAFIYVFLTACNSKTNNDDLGVSLGDTTKPFKKEIPRYPNGKFDIFYILSKTKQRQLGLDSLENGFDSLQVRVWYDFSLFTRRRLVV